MEDEQTPSITLRSGFNISRKDFSEMIKMWKKDVKKGTGSPDVTVDEVLVEYKDRQAKKAEKIIVEDISDYEKLKRKVDKTEEDEDDLAAWESGLTDDPPEISKDTSYTEFKIWKEENWGYVEEEDEDEVDEEKELKKQLRIKELKKQQEQINAWIDANSGEIDVGGDKRDDYVKFSQKLEKIEEEIELLEE